MCKRVPLPFIALVIIFTFCQVIGTMCALPDLPKAQEKAILVEENMVCPMDGTIMCPTSLTASPQRQIKNSAVADVTLAPISISSAATPVGFSDLIIGSLTSADSIVPISIASPSVLRI
ncbi:MAG: hypothetical protein AABY61_12885 [Nitrospirota bacterium]